MKILVITNMYPCKEKPFWGIFVKEQVESLKKKGLEVDVFFINGIKSRWNYFSALWNLLKLIYKKRRYDIIHIHHTYCMPHALLAKLLIKNHPPIVFTFHEPEFLKPKEIRPEEADFLKKLVFKRSLKKWALKKADLIITVWSKLTETLNVNSYNVYTIPCGINAELFKPLPREVCRKQLNLPLDRPIIFFPADVTRKTHKGVALFEESIKIVKEKIPSILVLTGGKIKHEEMHIYMNAADVIVQTSLFEASPMVIKEALATGTPIVTTDVGDVKEVIGNTPGCYIVPPIPDKIAEAIIQALSFKGKTSGKERIERLGLTLDKVADKLVNIYQSLVDSK